MNWIRPQSQPALKHRNLFTTKITNLTIQTVSLRKPRRNLIDTILPIKNF